jgi:hypothetical protein
VSNKFEEAVAESLRAVESYHRATETISEMVEALDAAVSAETTSRVRVKTEIRPTGPCIHIFVYVDNAPDRQREVCALRPSQSGYPIEVLSFGNTRTGCPDVESLEYKLLSIVRDARFERTHQTLATTLGTSSCARLGSMRRTWCGWLETSRSSRSCTTSLKLDAEEVVTADQRAQSDRRRENRVQ